MKNLTKALFIIFMIGILSGCASIVSKSNWPLSVNTSPNGAKVEITDKKGITVYSGNTPATISLRSGSGFFAR